VRPRQARRCVGCEKRLLIGKMKRRLAIRAFVTPPTICAGMGRGSKAYCPYKGSDRPIKDVAVLH